MLNTKILDEPMRLIAMARVGAHVDEERARLAAIAVLDVRDGLRDRNLASADLDRAHAILCRMALGHAPSTNDCIMAVHALSCRLQDISASDATSAAATA